MRNKGDLELPIRFFKVEGRTSQSQRVKNVSRKLGSCGAPSFVFSVLRRNTFSIRPLQYINVEILMVDVQIRKHCERRHVPITQAEYLLRRYSRVAFQRLADF